MSENLAITILGSLAIVSEAALRLAVRAMSWRATENDRNRKAAASGQHGISPGRVPGRQEDSASEHAA
jgi:hypothetical protein